MISKIITHTYRNPKPCKFAFIALMTVTALSLPYTASHAMDEEENETPWYEIEVIIFTHTNQLGLNSETWPEEAKYNDYSRIIELKRPNQIDAGSSLPVLDPVIMDTTETDSPSSISSTSAIPGLDDTALETPYVLLEKTQLKLNDMSNQVSQSPNYEVLLHIAWRQPTLSRKDSVPVYVYENMTKEVKDTGPQTAGRNSTDDITLAQAQAMNPGGLVTPLPQTQTILNEDQIGPKPPRLSGTLRVSVSRYLHIESDLHLRLPLIVEEEVVVDTPAMNETESGFSSFFGIDQPQSTETILRERTIISDFRLAESRRLRSSEIHYFDNPMFGMIVQVLPYEVPRPEPEPEPAPLPAATEEVHPIQFQ